MPQLALQNNFLKSLACEVYKIGFYWNLFSKKQNENVWPDELGPKPDFKNVNWKLSDSKLATDLCKQANCSENKGPTSAHNRAKKYFRDKRREYK
jgi:hypothetical protein